MSTATPNAPERIRQLAAIQTDEPVVLSVYLNLDPTEFPTPKDRDAQIGSLMDEAAARASEQTLSHDAGRALAEDVERVRDWITSSLDPDGTHGVAVFCCSPAGLFETFRLSTPLQPAVRVGRTPHIEPLASALPMHSWCVFLVNRRVGRIFRGGRGRLVEIGHLEDDVRGRHDQGGWSQARYQRSVEKDVADHVQNACDRLFESFQGLPFDKLLLGCPSELRPEIESKLHPYVAERLVAHVEVEVEHDNADGILERVEPAMEGEERRMEAELLEQLAHALGRGELAVAGLEPVLDALVASRVEVLLVEPGFSAAGVACPDCGWLGTAGSECPVDGGSLQQRDDVVEAAVEKAILQSAGLHEVRYHSPDLGPGAERIAAILRF